HLFQHLRGRRKLPTGTAVGSLPLRAWTGTALAQYHPSNPHVMLCDIAACACRGFVAGGMDVEHIKALRAMNEKDRRANERDCAPGAGRVFQGGKVTLPSGKAKTGKCWLSAAERVS